MGNLKFLRSKATELPEEVQDGNVYFQKQIKALTADIGTERYRINPPTDWNETLKNSPSYIENKPELGTVASHDVAEEIAQTDQIPTAKLVYNTNRELERKLETAKSAAVGPLVAEAIAEMTDLTRPYVYVGEESGMNVNHWYWYDGETWRDGGIYNSQGVDTDKTLLVANKAADAATVGNLINNLQGDTEDLYIKVDKLIEFQESQEVLNETLADDMEVTDGGYAYLLHNGNRIGGPYGPFAGNGGYGGGGGGYDAIDAQFNAQNTTEWSSATISDGEDLYFSFTWESIENDSPNGRGTVTITVNNVAQPTLSVPQGDNRINLKNYYKPGTNRIRIRIADQYDQGKSWIVTVNIISLTIQSSFSTASPFTDVIPFAYSPSGNDIYKTIYFVIDKDTENETTYTITTRAGNKELSQILPAQSHGGHTLDVYFTAEINGEPIRSNTLHYEFISIQEGATDVIIISPFTDFNQKQFSQIVIPYSVYDPANISGTEVSIYVNDVLYSKESVDRSQHTFAFKANHAGECVVKFVSGNTTRTMTLTIEESDVEIVAETEGLEFYLTAAGKSNNSDTRGVWEYGDIIAEFTNFEYLLDGWVVDSGGATALRTIGDARVYIPFKPFDGNFASRGKTIEIEFSTHSVIDYTAPIISCMYDNIGFEITPQLITFRSPQKELSTPFKDNEHIRITMVVEASSTKSKLIILYINGIMSTVETYPNGENFSQGKGTAVGISIGSNLCGVDIYNMRVYNHALTREQVIINWIADTPYGDLMVDRFNRNNIFDNGIINPSTLPSDLPYFILNASSLPDTKIEDGEKPKITVSFTDPSQPAKSFTAEGVQINVQGTSSQAYYRKNYDLQFKKGFNLNTGHSDSYVIKDALPFNRFVLKADVASSESTNNTRLTMFYNDTCPYKTTEMIQNPKVRWGIEGRPCVVFWNNTDTGELIFLGR